jgi:hypothetical protein
VIASTLLILAPGEAFAFKKVPDPELLDTKPPKAAGDTDVVAIKLPALDALDKLKIREEKRKNGKTFAIRVTTKDPIFIWGWVLRRGTDGVLTADPTVMKDLPTNQEVTYETEYKAPAKGKPWGTYRFVLLAVHKPEYFRAGTTNELTPAGRQVQAAIDHARSVIERAIRRSEIEARMANAH